MNTHFWFSDTEKHNSYYQLFRSYWAVHKGLVKVVASIDIPSLPLLPALFEDNIVWVLVWNESSGSCLQNAIPTSHTKQKLFLFGVFQ